MRKRISIITLLVLTMMLMTSCNPKDYLMLAMGDVNKESIVITPDNIDDYIGLKACESTPDSDAPYTVSFTNKRLDDGYAVFGATTIEGTATLYFYNTSITYEDFIDIFNFFNGFNDFYSEWEAQSFADSTTASEVLSDLGDYEFTIDYVSLDNKAVTIDYNEETNMRTLKFGMNRIECNYCTGNEF